MKAFLLLLFLTISSAVYGRSYRLYKGYMPITHTDSTGKEVWVKINPSNPKEQWYYECYLLLRDDSAFLERHPGHFRKSHFTVSDTDAGGLSQYKGTFVQRENSLSMKLIMEYMAFSVGAIKQPDGTLKPLLDTLSWKGNITTDGILINGVLFKRVTKTMLH